MSSAAFEQPPAERDHFEVPVRTPAGASHHFAVWADELVAALVAAAISYFVEKNELATGDYGLAVIRAGQAEPLADTSRLSEYDITDRDVLVLVPEAPQVDG